MIHIINEICAAIMHVLCPIKSRKGWWHQPILNNKGNLTPEKKNTTFPQHTQKYMLKIISCYHFRNSKAPLGLKKASTWV